MNRWVVGHIVIRVRIEMQHSKLVVHHLLWFSFIQPFDPMLQCFGVDIAANDRHQRQSVLHEFVGISGRMLMLSVVRCFEMKPSKGYEGQNDAVWTLGPKH